MRTLSILAGGIALATLAGGQAVAQQQVTWRMQALWDANTTPYDFEQVFVDRVAELTDGNFRITLFSGGQLVPAAEAFEAVQQGAFEMMKTFDGYEAGAVPAFYFSSTVPLGFETSDQMSAWFYELGGLEMVRDAYDDFGLHYIAPTVYGEEPIHSTFPIESLADLDGRIGRFVGLAGQVMAALGVNVTPMATGEVYSSLERGVIEFADRGDLTANLEAGLAEVADYIVLPGVHQPVTATSYVANQEAWDALPRSYQAALEVAAREVSEALRQHILVQNGVALAAFEDAGVEVIYLDAEDVSAGRSVAVDAWRAAAGDDPLANRILDSQITFLERLGLL